MPARVSAISFWYSKQSWLEHWLDVVGFILGNSLECKLQKIKRIPEDSWHRIASAGKVYLAGGQCRLMLVRYLHAQSPWTTWVDWLKIAPACASPGQLLSFAHPAALRIFQSLTKKRHSSLLLTSSEIQKLVMERYGHKEEQNHVTGRTMCRTGGHHEISQTQKDG